MNIAEQLRRDEGYRNFPYTDTVGKLSIGVGRNLTDVGLSDAEIEILLQNDIEKVTALLKSHLPYFDALDEVRRGVLQNMCFNLGVIRLEEFTKMLAAFAQGDWQEASKQMLNSLWAVQVGPRAERLARQIVTGQWV